MITWLLLLLAICALGFVLLPRIKPCPPAPSPPPPTADVSVIIPARNEEKNISILLDSLAEQTSRPREVVVMDDGSTDHTADIAREKGARVISAPPLPEGWRGKTWACWNGVQNTQGDTLLFLDADTSLEPDALARFETARRTNSCRVLSVAPYHRTGKPYEQLSALFNLMTVIGTGAFSILGRHAAPRGLFGPMLMIDRADYLAVDGHRAVRGEILEHMSLAPHLARAEVPMCCLAGAGALETRMYPDGLRSLIEGWSKAFAAGAAKTNPITLMLTIVWLSGGTVAFSLAALSLWRGGPLAAAWIAYAVFALTLARTWRRIGSFSALTALLYPIPLGAFFAIFGRSLLLRLSGNGVTWKGRRFDPASDKESSSP